MNPFELAAKAKQIEELAKEAQSVWHLATTVDANGNGIADSVELLEHLKALPELIKKEGSDVAHEAEEARQHIGDKMRAIIELVGEDVAAIQASAGKDIEKLKAHAAKLQ